MMDASIGVIIVFVLLLALCLLEELSHVLALIFDKFLVDRDVANCRCLQLWTKTIDHCC